MNATKKVGLWIRVSTDEQAKGESPEHHEDRGRMYAEMRDWEVVEIYNLAGVSGKAVISHPTTQKMLRDIKTGKITGLIFSKLARLARNTKELLEFSDFFREHDADLVSLQEAIDTSSPSGRLFYTIISAVAEWEREEIVSRVKASVPVRAKLGKSLGGIAPYGYKWVDNQLQVDETEAPTRKLIFELFAKHKRKKTTVRMLNEAGYRARKGNKFSSQGITKLLSDPVAKGMRRVNYKTANTKNGKAWDYKPESEWIFVKVPAIVSEELWNTCNAILEEQTVKRPKAKRVTHLFSSHIRCHCGGKMYVPSNSPKYVCQTCRNKISKEDMEDIFHEQLRSFLFSAKDIEAYLSQATNVLHEKEELLKSLQKDVIKLETQLQSLIDLHGQGQIPTHKFGEHYNPVNDRLEQIQSHIPEVQEEIATLRHYYSESDKVLNEARDLHSKWTSLNFEEKRSIVEIIVDSIIIDREDITINLAYIPTSTPTTHPLLIGGEMGNHPKG